MQKIYDCGFYGGKFLPFHNGHKYCIKVASEECSRLVVIFFSNSEEELEIMNNRTELDKNYLSEKKRIGDIKCECEKYPNVEFATLDCSIMHKHAKEKGIDLWDSETEYVLRTVGSFQAVYSSEITYDNYFKRAYPWACHRLVDPPRIVVPISGTMIRNMKTEEALQWI